MDGDAGQSAQGYPRAAPLAERIGAARALAHHPRIDVTGFEADIGTGYTFETIRYLRRHCPGVRFVWIMGADNLRSFHRWQNWRGIADLMPIAVIDRLGPSLYATASTAGQALARARIPETAARSLPDRTPPAWVYLHGLKSPLSSTALRALRGSHKTDAKAPQYGDCGTPAVETVGPAVPILCASASRFVKPRKREEPKGKGPWQHLHSFGPARVAPPQKSPRCVLTPRRFFA